MYIAYVDESGDIGRKEGSSVYFALSALIVHETRWQTVQDSIVQLRRSLREKYGLKLREEIHAQELAQRTKSKPHIAPAIRLRLLRDVLDFEASQVDLSVINVVINKQGKADTYDVFEMAWTTMIQRLNNTAHRKNFPVSGNQMDKVLLVVDQTDEPKLRKLSRKMRVFNPIPHTNNRGSGSRMLPTTEIVKDPIHRSSKHSYFVQLADVNAYFLKQWLQPNNHVRSKGARNFFLRLDPILCKKASRTQAQGVVIL